MENTGRLTRPTIAAPRNNLILSGLRIDEYLAAPGIGYSAGIEPNVSKQEEPGIPREDAENMRVMNNADGLVSFAEQVGEVNGVGRIAGIGIERPLDVANGPAVTGSAVMTAMRCE